MTSLYIQQRLILYYHLLFWFANPRGLQAPSRFVSLSTTERCKTEGSREIKKVLFEGLKEFLLNIESLSLKDVKILYV